MEADFLVYIQFGCHIIFFLVVKSRALSGAYRLEINSAKGKELDKYPIVAE